MFWFSSLVKARSGPTSKLVGAWGGRTPGAGLQGESNRTPYRHHGGDAAAEPGDGWGRAVFGPEWLLSGLF